MPRPAKGFFVGGVRCKWQLHLGEGERWTLHRVDNDAIVGEVNKSISEGAAEVDALGCVVRLAQITGEDEPCGRASYIKEAKQIVVNKLTERWSLTLPLE